MAWVCIRCQRKIYAPQLKAHRYAMKWRYVKKTEELTIDMANLHKIRDRSTLTHLYCDVPEIDGFKVRMRRALGMSSDRDHPLFL